MVVFSSLDADDISHRRTQARGMLALRDFLHYARTGALPAREEGRPAARSNPIADTICGRLAAAGCQIVLFTTGRGTPFSTFVPTMKIATNQALAEKKKNWIDFSAHSMDEDSLFKLLIDTANGDYVCKSEDVREIAFYKTGVTL